METHTSDRKMPTPCGEPSFRHIMPVQTRFNDFDMLGHLNNSVYFQLFDLGKIDYFRCMLPGGLDWHNLNVVVAHIECDYLAPCYITEELVVMTTITHIGEKSFNIEQRLANAQTKEIKCVSRTVMVGFDLKTGHTIPISQKWIDAFDRYEGKKVE